MKEKSPGCLACQIKALEKPDNMESCLSQAGKDALCKKHKKILNDWRKTKELNEPMMNKLSHRHERLPLR